MINVKLEKFEGPLSLLLKMIEAEKLDITEVSLAKIADQYVEYIKTCQVIDPELLADFLVVAAKLLWIKSRALLPYLFPAEEEDCGELERQLRMYKEFLEAMKGLEEMLFKKRFSFSPVGRNLRKIIGQSDNFFSPPKKLSAADLSLIMNNFLNFKAKSLVVLEERVIEHQVSIEEKIAGLQKSLLSRLKVSFKDFVDKAQSRTEVVVCFLAMLELMKQKFVDVDQQELFSEISITRKEIIEI
jgi:segregation and condensation protein A